MRLDLPTVADINIVTCYVTREGVWIVNRIEWSLETRNFNNYRVIVNSPTLQFTTVRAVSSVCYLH
jgi:hypothetical protein